MSDPRSKQEYLALKIAQAFDKGYCAALEDAAELVDNIFGGDYLWLNEGILGLADHDFEDLLSSGYRRSLIKNSGGEQE